MVRASMSLLLLSRVTFRFAEGADNKSSGVGVDSGNGTPNILC